MVSKGVDSTGVSNHGTEQLQVEKTQCSASPGPWWTQILQKVKVYAFGYRPVSEKGKQIMEVANLISALIPVFFVLLLGYLAGKAHSFDQEQTAGLSKLALNFALPASLFSGMAALPRDLLAHQARLVLCLIAVHVGVLLLSNLTLRKIFRVQATRSLVFSLILASSATPVFGVAILSPLLGKTSIAAVGLVALAINFAIPLAVILFEMDAATKPTKSMDSETVPVPVSNPAIDGLKVGLRSPLLWSPILGCLVALTGRQLPLIVNSSLNFIGSATSGVAVFAVGLTLAAHPLVLSRSVFLGSLARVTVQSLSLMVLAHWVHVSGPIYREALICCSFPPATTATLLAAKYRSSEAESASILLLTTLLLAATIPTLLYISH